MRAEINSREEGTKRSNKWKLVSTWLFFFFSSDSIVRQLPPSSLQIVSAESQPWQAWKGEQAARQSAGETFSN